MMNRRYSSCLLALLFALPAWCAEGEAEEDYRPNRWEEAAWQLPLAPREDRLLSFYVSASTTNRFFVDGSSITVGPDGVVRYVLVIQGGQGARTVTFEGMRCETREKRIYSAGRADGSWSPVRKAEWSKVVEIQGNRYHAALFQEYFCPNGVIVRNADEALEAFRRGGFTDITR